MRGDRPDDLGPTRAAPIKTPAGGGEVSIGSIGLVGAGVVTRGERPKPSEEAHMSDVPHDDQSEAEALDRENFDPGAFPPERPLGIPDLVRSDALTAGEQADDSIADRHLREEPDVFERASQADDRVVGGLIAREDAEGTDGAVASGELLGSVGEDDLEFDGLSDSDIAHSGMSAEEAAVHVIPDDRL